MTTRLLLATSAALCLSAGSLLAQNEPGHVLDHLLIAQDHGGFGGPLLTGDLFGSSVAEIGDLDGDGVLDLAVGAYGTSTAGTFSSVGRVWLLFMNADGTVGSSTAIDEHSTGLTGLLQVGDTFGSSVEAAGDLNGDGVPDLWVGAPGDEDGAVYGLLLFPSGKVKSAQRIDSATPGLSLGPDGAFGCSIAVVGDVFGDGVADLVVGAKADDGGGFDRGAVYLFDLKPGGAINSVQRLGPGSAQLEPSVTDQGAFGGSVEGLGDVDGNGTPDFAVGADGDSVVGVADGSVFIVFNDSNGPLALRKIDGSAPGFGGDIPQTLGHFGGSLAALGDIDGDGDVDLAVGAASGGQSSHGSVWMLRLSADPDALLEAVTRVDDEAGFLGLNLEAVDAFGYSVASVADLDGNGVRDLLVGLPGRDGVATNEGAMARLSLRGPTVRDLGHGLAGSYAPRLTAEGLLLDGTPFAVELSNAQPFKPAFFILGFSLLNVPFRGGTMVPEFDVFSDQLVTDASGELKLSALWPGGIPAGFTTYIQYWMSDAGAPVGLNASNAIGLVAAE